MLVPYLRRAIRSLTVRLGFAVVDLRHDQSPSLLLPGHLRTVFERLEVTRAIDVGANRGQWVSTIRRFYEGPILSVEPDSSTFAELQRAADSDPKWDTIRLALGAEDGHAPLHRFAATDLNSLHPPRDNLAMIVRDARPDEIEEVTIRTLDGILVGSRSATDRIFLKIDTQGHDLEVLAGARETLAAVVGLQVELSVVPLYDGVPDYLTVLARLRDIGFVPSGFFPVAVTTGGTILEFDAVLVRS